MLRGFFIWVSRVSVHEAEAASVEHFERRLKLMRPAHDKTPLGDDGPGSLPSGEGGSLLDSVEGLLAGAPKNRKNRTIPSASDGVIAPIALRHHSPVKAQETVEFAAVKEHKG